LNKEKSGARTVFRFNVKFGKVGAGWDGNLSNIKKVNRRTAKGSKWLRVTYKLAHNLSGGEGQVGVTQVRSGISSRWNNLHGLGLADSDGNSEQRTRTALLGVESQNFSVMKTSGETGRVDLNIETAAYITENISKIIVLS
jgi:hypothetical protein